MSTVKDEILKRIKAKAGGNSDRGLKELASDILSQMHGKDSEIAGDAVLAASTIKRMRELTPAESGQEYRPQAETIERILKAANVEISVKHVKIQKRYMPKPKPKEDKEGD